MMEYNDVIDTHITFICDTRLGPVRKSLRCYNVTEMFLKFLLSTFIHSGFIVGFPFLKQWK